MHRSSDIAYGEWNIDYRFQLKNVISTKVAFILNDKNNPNLSLGGHTEAEYLANAEGSGLMLTSNFKGTPNLFLFKYTGDSNVWEELATTGLEETAYPDNFHLRITRNTTGQFTVYGNSKQLIQTTDNNFSISEYFGLLSFRTGFQLDNIKVYNTIRTTTNPISPFWMVVPVLFIFVLLRKKRFR